jgi:hypothetical protein
MKRLSFGFLLLLSQALPLGLDLMASQRVGNGGFVAVCREGQQTSYHLLDYLDGEFRFAQLGKVDLGPDADHVEHARYAFERLAKVDPARSAEYLLELEKFFDPNNLKFLGPDYPLPVATDSGVDMVPANCKTLQIASNTRPFQPEEPKFWIKKDLWEKLNEIHKAGLIIHEIVYNDALIRGHSTSEYARYFTFLISSEKFADLSQATYDQKLLDNYLGEVSSLYQRIDVRERTRFFTSKLFSFEQAKDFCNKLPGVSWLSNGYGLGQRLLQSDIGKYIMNHMPGGRTEVWINGSVPRTQVIDENADSNPLIDKDPTELFGVICLVDQNTL